MALVYRGHFALISRPIFTSKGFNTSAIFVFTQTLVDLIRNQNPTHMAVVFDTEAPTFRHTEFPDYKAQREEMPEDLSKALPHVRRIIEAFQIPVLTLDGYEADDIIGTLTLRAEKEDFETLMVTPDKDFGQLVSEKTRLYRPSRMGDGVEILGPSEVKEKWGIERVEQVIDILGLQGDTSDNIPGVPGVGPKTAAKLIGEYGSVENLVQHTDGLKGKLKERIVENKEQALLSKRLATIDRAVPIEVSFDDLKCRPFDEDKLKALLVEFEFNALGKRLLGDEFKAGRGYEAVEPELFKQEEVATTASGAPLKTIAEVEHEYHLVESPGDRAALLSTLQKQSRFSLDLLTEGRDPAETSLLGIAFSFEAHAGYFISLPADRKTACGVLSEFRPVLEDEKIEKVGHHLKFDLLVLRWCGINVRGTIFDTLLAHSLIEPEMRHALDFVAESLLGYSPQAIEKLVGGKGAPPTLRDLPLGTLAETGAERADLAWQLKERLEPQLKERGQERVFHEIEAPLLPVLADMEFEGIRVDPAALEEVGEQLAEGIREAEAEIYQMAGCDFNLNSPRQLGEVLFERLKIGDAPKKTRTGQYSTDEQTLLSLAGRHEIIDRILRYREATKLKSTYIDTLPGTISERTGRVHTTFGQAFTATGRLQSQDPNLQNIPVRSELGREIRRAFVPRDVDHLLLSADYSQIELRIIAALSGDAGMIKAFADGVDIHTATAAKVFGVDLKEVTPEMRRRAKMVNFGIAYGISAFGLAQRLGIARSEAAEIINQYFAQYPAIRQYMTNTIESTKRRGFAETVTGRRRYLRDINSRNATVRGAAERNAINAPIQGTAADMIKIAMVNIHRELVARKLKSKMVLQVHDELLFDMLKEERDEVEALVTEKMRTAIQLDVPIVVEAGAGENWLEAH